MRRFVRTETWRAVILGIVAVLLVAIVEAETAVSYLIVIGLLAMTIWRDRVRYRREKHGAEGQF
jgi:hypothetical protein